MVGSVFALSLLGLSAVNALPASLQDRQGFIIGGPPSSGAITPGDGGLPTCNPDIPPESQQACIYPPFTGTINPTPKTKRQQLTNPSNAEAKKIIKTLELELQRLQAKKNKTKDEKKAIEVIKKELKRLAGVVNITPAPGGSTTIVPGKRDEGEFSLGSFGAYKDHCPFSTQGLQAALTQLLRKPHRSEEETLAIVEITHILSGCGQSISDGTATLTPIHPRDDVSFVGLEAAYLEAVKTLGDNKPSFTSWLILSGIAETLKEHGITVPTLGSGTTTLVPRQQRIGTCEPIDVLLLLTLYRSFLREYGYDTSKWPNSVTSQARSILTVLSLCGEPTSTITPVPYIPGGSITPSPTYPGGTINPNPTIPGGAITPVPYIPGGSFEPSPTYPGGSLNPTKRSADTQAALEALHILEKAYGTYDSGKIPAAIFLPMANLVAYLEGQGVVVLGWPKTTIGKAP